MNEKNVDDIKRMVEVFRTPRKKAFKWTKKKERTEKKAIFLLLMLSVKDLSVIDGQAILTG